MLGPEGSKGRSASVANAMFGFGVKISSKRRDRCGKAVPELCKMIKFYKTKQNVMTWAPPASPSHCNKELN